MNMSRLFVLIAAVALVAAACTTASPQTTSTEASASTSTTEEPSVSNPRLLILDEEGTILVLDGEGEEIESIAPAPGFRFAQPIWTTTESILATELAPTESYVTATALGGEQLWRTAFASPPFYYVASPGDGAPTVLALRNNDVAAGLITEAIDAKGEVTPIGDEAPFYMSWDPGGERFATHVAGTRVDVGSDPPQTILETTAMFQAPIWLDDGLAVLRTSGSSTFLSLWDGDSFTDLGMVRGAARFVGQGSRIAIQTGAGIDTGGVQALAQALPTIPAGTLTVVDTDTGKFTSVTSESSAIFQWDPSGTRLLYATLMVEPEPALIWHVWESGDTVDFGPFSPDPSWFQTIVPFFDQYAQSVSMWSADGSSFAYPAIVDGVPSILVQEITGSEARVVGQGSWVAWAPGGST
ncbi:MAG: hypothetical protein BMS9Abin17_0843 [Acidimicrobiia bacterium]|nr:MAG: hypothetical protein BMS9Abin17_0843 [Acidimicrobiia bacterium]